MKNSLKLVFTALAFGLLSLPAQGQLMVYRNGLKTTATGTGRTVPYTTTGYTIYDGATGSLTALYVYPRWRTFQVRSLDDWNISLVTGSLRREYTVYSQASAQVDTSGQLVLDTAMVKGLNVMTDIGDTNRWSIPRVMKATVRAVYPSSAEETLGESWVDETSGTLSLDLRNTRYFNWAGFGTSEVLNVFRGDLIARGYTEE